MTCTSTHTVDINCNENQSLGVWWVAVKGFQTSKWYCTKDERCAELCDVERFSFSFLATIHHEIIYSLLD